MKLSTIEKQLIKKEIKKQKAPRVLNFDKEILLKKNENLTVVELQEKVNASIKANFLKMKIFVSKFVLIILKKKNYLKLKIN